jgi:hypothetical protein
MGKHLVVARVAATADFRLQQAVFVTFSVEALCLFEKTTSIALNSQLNDGLSPETTSC